MQSTISQYILIIESEGNHLTCNLRKNRCFQGKIEWTHFYFFLGQVPYKKVTRIQLKFIMNCQFSWKTMRFWHINKFISLSSSSLWTENLPQDRLREKNVYLKMPPLGIGLVESNCSLWGQSCAAMLRSFFLISPTKQQK